MRKANTSNLWALLFSLFSFMISEGIQAQDLPTPASHFGYRPGTDRMLFDYEDLTAYLHKLDEASGMLEMRQIGESPMGKPMYIAFISTPDNIDRLDSLQTINRELALHPELSDKQRQTYQQSGKVFILSTLSMHSNEVGPSQAAPLMAYQLLTSDSLHSSLKDVVLMLAPNHNPDGMNMVVDHYNKYKGTKYEGARLPDVYHKYVGHDNNRDFVTLTQKDNRAIAAIYNKTWFPQVMVEKHQMGSAGPRYFVPPPHDPIAQNVDGRLWNWVDIFGSHMMEDMTERGLKGVSQQYLFDDYWPGTTETCIWKGVIGMLTEAARVQYATPVYIEPNELKTYGKGLGEYAKSINMPEPWQGGWWRLQDILTYELESLFSMIRTSSRYKADILRFRNTHTQREVKKGRTQAPYYYILPAQQHDKSEWVHVVNLLQEHGINTYALKADITLNNRLFKAGDVVVPLAQPFRAFVKEVLEDQTFPERHYTPGGQLIKPYDITSWSLPRHKGVACVELNTRSQSLEALLKPLPEPFAIRSKARNDKPVLALPASYNQSYRLAFKALQHGASVYRTGTADTLNGRPYPAGSFFIRHAELPADFASETQITPHRMDSIPQKARAVKLPKTGLIESHFHDMDAGWTRYVLDTYNIPFEVIRPQEIQQTDLKEFDVLIFPSERKSVLLKGRYKSGNSYASSTYPPEYTQGMEAEGLTKVWKFINAGGRVVSWGQSVDLFEGNQKIKAEDEVKERFSLPFKNVSEQLKKEPGVYVPGAFVRMTLKPDHPLTYGCRKETGIFYKAHGIFATDIPHFDMDRRVIGKIAAKNVLVSGYAEHQEALEKKPVMLWVKKGRGDLVLYGFNPQYRASTDRNFKLLFNALFA